MQNHGRLENKNIWKGWKWGKVYGILLSFHGEKTDKGCGSPLSTTVWHGRKDEVDIDALILEWR